jgi:hypothetical protein
MATAPRSATRPGIARPTRSISPARIARDLATLFTAAGVTVAIVYAVTFLREAVEKGDASLATVRYVRAFVAADDPSQNFDPPEPAAN